MRTSLFLASGFLLLASFAILSRLFSQHFPSMANWAISAFILLWLAITLANMWVGVSKAGYAVAEELPIFILLFAIPTAVAVIQVEISIGCNAVAAA